MGMDLGLGYPPNDLEPEVLVGRVAKGPPQAVAPKGPVCWLFGALELEEVDEGKEPEEADEAEEDEGNPKE